MPIAGTSSSTDKDIFYTERFKKIVRSEKELLLRNALTIPIVHFHNLYAARNDIYRFLRSNKVPEHLLWTTAYLNDIEDPNQDISSMTFYYTVDESVLIKAITRANTKQG